MTLRTARTPTAVVDRLEGRARRAARRRRGACKSRWASRSRRTSPRAELFAFPLLFLVSLLVFRGLVAALLPLAVGMTTVLTTFLLCAA